MRLTTVLFVSWIFLAGLKRTFIEEILIKIFNLSNEKEFFQLIMIFGGHGHELFYRQSSSLL